jgi:hypothetical protein
MKICPQCSFVNEECFPTCVYCNRSLADVQSVPAADPEDPEHAVQAAIQERHKTTRKHVRFAWICYVLIIAGSAALVGPVTEFLPLSLYFVGAILVAAAVYRGIAGQLGSCFFQGFITMALLWYFGPIHPLTLFMLAVHIIVASILWHWLDLIQSTTV